VGRAFQNIQSFLCIVVNAISYKKKSNKKFIRIRKLSAGTYSLESMAHVSHLVAKKGLSLRE